MLICLICCSPNPPLVKDLGNLHFVSLELRLNEIIKVVLLSPCTYMSDMLSRKWMLDTISPLRHVVKVQLEDDFPKTDTRKYQQTLEHFSIYQIAR